VSIIIADEFGSCLEAKLQKSPRISLARTKTTDLTIMKFLSKLAEQLMRSPISGVPVIGGASRRKTNV
jgi:hypothetical protein